MRLNDALSALPLIAILRGIKPDEAVDMVGALFEAGFRIVEVPLNSPQPLISIARIAEKFGNRMLVGAGTVLTSSQLEEVAGAGGQLIVAPNFDAAVVKASKSKNLVSIPGIATPSEAFAALQAGADAIKLFPAEMILPVAVKAIRAVLPPAAILIPVGGITPTLIAPYRQAGANAFGLGSALFKPGMTVQQVAASAEQFSKAVQVRTAPFT